MKISVSFLKSLLDKSDTIKKIEQTNCNYIHVDVMDGLFVRNITEDLTKYISNTNKKLDVHLMVNDPIKFIKEYENLNIEYIIFHVEIDKDIDELIRYLKSKNIKVGISIKPDTPIDKIINYLPVVDQVLVMSVNPGEGGQEFIESTITKIDQLKAFKLQNNYHYLISVDGGINADTILKVKNADMVVSGSYICMADDYQEKINKLKNLLK